MKLIGAGAALDFLETLEDEMSDDEAYVGSSAKYASYVEFGTSKMAAQPYLRPALDKALKSQRMESVLSGVLEGEIENKALQIAFHAEKLGTEKAPVDTGNLMGSIAAGPTKSEMMSKSEANKK